MSFATDLIDQWLGYSQGKASRLEAQKKIRDIQNPPTLGKDLNAPADATVPDMGKIGASEALTSAFRDYQARKANTPTPDEAQNNTALGIPTAPTPTLPPEIPTTNPRETFAKQINLPNANLLGMETDKVPDFLKLEQANYYGGRNAATAAGKSGLNVTWETATPQQQSLAKGIAMGSINPTVFSMRGPDRNTLVSLANEYAQANGLPFRTYEAAVKEGMAKSLAYGTIGKNVISYNTAIGHGGDALDAFERLGNTDITLLNKPLNWIRQNLTNNPDIGPLNASLTALRGELANAFKNTGGTDQEIAHWMDVLSSDLTPIQAMSTIRQINTLLGSRLDAIKYQQGNVMDESSANRDLASPKTERIIGGAGNNSTTVNTPPPPPPVNPGPSFAADLQNAQAAVASGADRNAVISRLKQAYPGRDAAIEAQVK